MKRLISTLPMIIISFLVLNLGFSCTNEKKPIQTKKVEEVDERRLNKGNLINPIEKDSRFKDIDYDGFESLTAKINNYRKERLVYLDDFKKLMKRNDIILLDTRSKNAYDKFHIEGAIHLNFSDFTEEKLSKIIRTKESPILIYCNNNFIPTFEEIASKSPRLALNIPTFINLYGYGYKNIYELYTPERLDPKDKQLAYKGSRINGLKKK